jgi:hypothetical protein
VYILKRSLTLVGLLLLVGVLAAVMPLVSRGQGRQLPFPLRKFYLTQGNDFKGDQTVSACAAGYHMASLWEIFDTSNLSYDVQLGFTNADSGFGPPSSFGWVRTGHVSMGTNLAGIGNCNAWTSASKDDYGSIVAPYRDVWDNFNFLTPVSPWSARTFPCDAGLRVWCIQH